MSSRISRFSLLGTLFAAACGGNMDEAGLSPAEPATAEQAIQDGYLVPTGSSLMMSTVTLRNADDRARCTGTIIGERFILTASHCNPRPGDNVAFWSSATTRVTDRVIEAVFMPDWVNPLTSTVSTPSGKFSDIAVLRLASQIPTGYRPALLPQPSTDPHTRDGQYVYAVGSGMHDDVISVGAQLRYRGVYILNVDPVAEYSDGGLFVSEHATNGGDSGGPIYASTSSGLKVLGVLWGYRFRPESMAIRSYYTVTRDHLNFIYGAMNGTLPPTRILERTSEACSTTVRFESTTGSVYLPVSDSTTKSFNVASGEITWYCGTTQERTGCAPGTNALRVYRSPSGSRDFTVECRQRNPML